MEVEERPVELAEIDIGNDKGTNNYGIIDDVASVTTGTTSVEI